MKPISFTHITERPKTAPKTGPTNERATILQEFLEILNRERKPPYKPLTPARLGMMLAPVKTKDLYTFLADCKYAASNKPSGAFSKYFFWSCNPKKHNPQAK